MPALPADLAPALAEVPMVVAPPLVIDLTYRGPVCVVCHEGGKLGGHHNSGGDVEWIHRACHRLLHHRGQPRRTEVRRLRRLDRTALIAC